MANKKVAIAYIPVLHRGYLDFLHSLKEKGVEKVYIVSDDILASHEELDYIHRKDRLRALPHEKMLEYLRMSADIPVESLTIETILALQHERAHIISPREDINIFLVETYFGGHHIEHENIFLRWNRENIEEEDSKSKMITLSEFEKSAMNRAVVEAKKSADWWRCVGAVLVKNGKIVTVAHNEHMPEEESPNILGDTRALFTKGVNINYVTSAHAEVGVIGEAAKQGIVTLGAELFVTDFPCPYCARLIAKAGIKKIYYLKGYAVLGGDEFFREMGIESLKVKI